MQASAGTVAVEVAAGFWACSKGGILNAGTADGSGVISAQPTYEAGHLSPS